MCFGQDVPRIHRKFKGRTPLCLGGVLRERTLKGTSKLRPAGWKKNKRSHSKVTSALQNMFPKLSAIRRIRNGGRE